MPELSPPKASPLDTQIELLKHALEHRDDLAAMIEPTLQAWMKRDLAGIHAVSERIGARYPEMAEHYRILFRRVVENQRPWLMRLRTSCL